MLKAAGYEPPKEHAGGVLTLDHPSGDSLTLSPGGGWEHKKYGSNHPTTGSSFDSLKQHLENPSEFTADELYSASHYQDTGYNVINDYWRSGAKDYPEYARRDAEEHTKNLDSLIDKQIPLGKDMVVYRGINDNHPELSTRAINNPKSGAEALNPDDFIGAEIQDKGFTSTTKSPKKADDFSSPNGALFRIKVPAGSKALDYAALTDSQENYYSPLVGNPRKSAFMKERELLLPRGSRFKITGYNREEGGRIIWNAELVH